MASSDRALPSQPAATTTPDRAVAAWMAAVAARPVLTLVALAVLVAGAAWSAAGIRVDTDSTRMLAADLPYQRRAAVLNAAFPTLKEQLVVVIRAPSADAADAAARAVAARLRQRDEVLSEIFSGGEPVLTRAALLYLPPDELERRLADLRRLAPLLGALKAGPETGRLLALLALAAKGGAGEAVAPLQAEVAQAVRSVVEGRPRALAWSGAFAGAGEDPAVRTITARPALDYSRLSPARPAIDAVREELAALRLRAEPGVELGLTGEPVLRAEEMESVTRTLPLSLGLSLALVAVILRLFLGSTGRGLLALAALLATLVLTTGFAALAVGALNLISIAFVVLMVGLGIDFAIHVLAHLAEPGPEAVRARLAATGRTLGAALWLSALSTALAFLAFTLTDFVGMAQLGLIGGAGVLIAFAVAVTLIPAVVALWPGLLQAGANAAAPEAPAGRRPGRVAGLAAGALGLAAAWLATEARFDPDPMNLRDPASPSVVAHRWLAADPATAPDRFSVLAGRAGEAATLAARLGSVPGVTGATWLGDLVPEGQAQAIRRIEATASAIRRAIAAPGAAASVTPMTPLRAADALETPGGAAARDLAAALRDYAALQPRPEGELQRALFAHLPAQLDRLEQALDPRPITAQDLPRPLRQRYRSDEFWRVEVRAGDLSDPADRAQMVERLGAVAPGLTGPPTQIAGAERTVSAAMLQASALALVSTGVIAWVVLRRWRAVGAILLPLALAGAVVAAASVLLDLPFNFANVIVLPLMIGMGVDSGIHMASRAMRAGSGVFATSTPRAVLASALTTVAAFGTLGLSAHPGTASMGWMLAIALAAAVAMIFALTPVLIGLRLRR